MPRSTIDKLISSSGLIVAIVLLAAAGGLFYAHNFVHTQVRKQLQGQRIMFPAAASKALDGLPVADRTAVAKYAGQQVLTGAQAKVFADNYIGAHLREIGNGKTYAELSTASMTDPTNTALADKVQTVFRGETLRGLLLNAYAFDTMAIVARMAATIALAASALLFALAILGFQHSAKVKSRSRR